MLNFQDYSVYVRRHIEEACVGYGIIVGVAGRGSAKRVTVMWLFGRSSTDSSVSEVTPAQKQRSKQIGWLNSQVSG